MAMCRKFRVQVYDDDNPEWTEEDFAKARPPEEVLPPHLLAQFKATRGPQKALTKVAVSIRLSPEVISYFKAKGPGWQSRIDEALRKIAKVKTRCPAALTVPRPYVPAMPAISRIRRPWRSISSIVACT